MFVCKSRAVADLALQKHDADAPSTGEEASTAATAGVDWSQRGKYLSGRLVVGRQGKVR